MSEKARRQKEMRKYSEMNKVIQQWTEEQERAEKTDHSKGPVERLGRPQLAGALRVLYLLSSKQGHEDLCASMLSCVFSDVKKIKNQKSKTFVNARSTDVALSRNLIEPKKLVGKR